MEAIIKVRSTKKNIITSLVLCSAIVILIAYSFIASEKLGKLEQTLDSSIESYTNQVSDAFR
jgi:hypothetical protein